MMQKKSLFFILFLSVLFLPNPNVFADYEVRGKCVGSSIFFLQGKAESESCTDEVVYEVITDQKKIIRKAVRSAGAGLQQDNTEYNIIWDEPNADLPTKNKQISQQHIIKGIGQVAAGGGFELIVIGDDFITTSKSALNYFVLYYYTREP